MYATNEAAEYVNCELTKAEFAEALDLTPDSMFVSNMFELVDKNKNGLISFREFLDFFVIFKRG
jgi:dual oxidase